MHDRVNWASGRRTRRVHDKRKCMVSQMKVAVREHTAVVETTTAQNGAGFDTDPAKHMPPATPHAPHAKAHGVTTDRGV